MCFKFVPVTERKPAPTLEQKVKYFSSYSDALYILPTDKIELSHLRKKQIYGLCSDVCIAKAQQSTSFLEVRMSAEQYWLVRSHYSDAIRLFTCLITFSLLEHM